MVSLVQKCFMWFSLELIGIFTAKYVFIKYFTEAGTFYRAILILVQFSAKERDHKNKTHNFFSQKINFSAQHYIGKKPQTFKVLV